MDEVIDAVAKNHIVDTIISVGGGSPSDSTKAISYRVYQRSKKFLYYIAIPKTLSVAECTFLAGYTNENGVKTVFRTQGWFLTL